MKNISKRKNGYLQIDFAFAVFIFFYLIFIIYGLYNTAYSSHTQSIETLDMSSIPKDLCTYLISSPGSPEGWEFLSIDQVNSVGLNSDNFSVNSLSLDKIAVFAASPNFNAISDILNLDEVINIKIYGLENSVNYLNFGFPSETLSYTYSCYSKIGSEPVQVYVEVWK